jgi:hypothetical protein
VFTLTAKVAESVFFTVFILDNHNSSDSLVRLVLTKSVPGNIDRPIRFMDKLTFITISHIVWLNVADVLWIQILILLELLVLWKADS